MRQGVFLGLDSCLDGFENPPVVFLGADACGESLDMVSECLA
jgi:hypothetical protein